MRTRFLLFRANVSTGLLTGILALAAPVCLAQNPVPAQPASPAPASTPVTPPQTMPAPVPADPSQLTSRPGYLQEAAPPTVVPAPTQAPLPSVLPAQPTAAAPYTAMPAYVPYGLPDEDRPKQVLGSTYIPLDSWIYSAMVRLYGLGYVDSMFVSMRPWTRQSVLHMIEQSEDSIRESDDEEAQRILIAVQRELALEGTNDGLHPRPTIYGVESGYTRLMGITGQTLRDSYHIGQTVVNDYGRPYEPGFNSLIGFSSVNEYGRFSLYVRGEYQHSPSGTGYSSTLGSYLSTYDDAIINTGFNANQATIPNPIISAVNPFRLQEATLSFHVLGHELSAGKSDAWLGPAEGGALAWSNNAENIYSVRINRIEPLHIPFLSALIGPVRYDFFYGSLKGHTAPNHPYVHAEMFSFRPTVNFEFAFQRTVIFGGAGHEPVTLHTFLKSFLSVSDTTGAEKFSPQDPGARYSDFSMSYRLPFVRKYVTFVADSIAHDDVTPISAPRRAAFRTGLYLSQVPGIRHLDLRFEAIDTDPITSRSTNGSFNYYEVVQRQGYTNKGFITGDWIGREAKGGQAWITYHLSGNQFIQLEATNKKNDKDFIPGAPSTTAVDIFGNKIPFALLGGSTQNSMKVSVVKRFLHDDLEVNAWYQYERWKAPVYLPGTRVDSVTAVQFTYRPGLKIRTTN